MAPHGTITCYQYWGCRCALCRAVNRERVAQIRAQLRARPRWQVPHGTRGGYVNWSCRCPACTQAHCDYMTNYKRTHRQAA